MIIQELTPQNWPAFEDLFGIKGADGGCWCMYWRIGQDYRRRPAAENKADFRQLVEKGPPPGLLAMQGEQAVGWCQVTPRNDLPWLDQSWRLRRADSLPVWAISCFYIRIGFRRQGVSTALIDAAVDFARKGGAPALEAYPLDGTLSPSSTHTGYAATFAQHGFKEIARHFAPRPIMRYTFAESK